MFSAIACEGNVYQTIADCPTQFNMTNTKEHSTEGKSANQIIDQ